MSSHGGIYAILRHESGGGETTSIPRQTTNGACDTISDSRPPTNPNKVKSTPRYIYRLCRDLCGDLCGGG